MLLVPLPNTVLCQEPSALRLKDGGRDTAHTGILPEDYTINSFVIYTLHYSGNTTVNHWNQNVGGFFVFVFVLL